MELKPGYKQTEVGMIPEDWRTSKLQGITTSISSGKSNTKSKTGKFPIYGSTGIIGFQNYFDYEGDKVLVARVGANAGTVNRVTGKYCVSDNTLMISYQNNVDIRFSCYQLINRDLNLLVFGSGQPLITGGQLKELVMPLPPTKAEQTAIANALSDADVLIQSLTRLIAKKRQIKQGAMQELLSGKKRLPGFEINPGYKQTEVGLIPKDWELRALLTVVRIVQGQVDPSIEPYKSMILVGPGHVESGSGKLFIRQTAADQGAISGKYLFVEGDIVYGKINPYLQKAFLADFKGLCSADMYPLKPSLDVSPGFILAVILGYRFTKYAESVSVRSGMPKINRNEMKEFVFPLPPNKAEQNSIATILSGMDAEIAALEAKLAKYRHIKQGMMQNLLTGRIRLVQPGSNTGAVA